MCGPTVIIHLIDQFVGRNPYRTPAMTRCLASIKCSMLWLCKTPDKKCIRKNSRKIEKLKRLGARFPEGARSIHLHMKILDQYHIQLKDGFKSYCGMRNSGYLPDKPIWNMLKCWMRGVCPEVTKECLRVLRSYGRWYGWRAHFERTPGAATAPPALPHRDHESATGTIRRVDVWGDTTSSPSSFSSGSVHRKLKATRPLRKVRRTRSHPFYY